MTLLLWALLSANAFDQTFDRGVQAYEQGRFGESIDAFEQLVDQGVVDASLFYNLGNAYYRSAYLGPAIASYERALQLDPGFQNAQENLQRAVSQTERPMPRPQPRQWEQSLFFWHFGLNRGTTFAVFAAFWTAAWALLAVRLFRPWRYLRRAAAGALVLAFVFGASWWLKAKPPMLAVASGAEVPVRYGTRAEEAVRFELYAGDRVLVDERKGDWVRIVTARGERGWTQANRLLFVGPPFEPFRIHAAAENGPDAAESGGTITKPRESAEQRYLP